MSIFERGGLVTSAKPSAAPGAVCRWRDWFTVQLAAQHSSRDASVCLP